MAGARELVISLVGDSKNLTKSLDTATKDTKSFGQKAATASRVAGAAFTGAGVALNALAGPLEDSKLRLEGVGQQAGFAKGELDQLTNTNGKLKQAMRASGNSASEVNEALATLIPHTKNATEAKKALAVADELAARKGISLEQASEMVGRALAGGTKIMKEFGIEVGEGESRLDAMGKVLDGSVSTALQNTVRGRMNAAVITVKDFAAQVGKNLGPALTALGPALVALPTLISGVSKAMSLMKVAMTAIMAHPLILAIAVAGAIIVGLVLLEKKFGIVSGAVKALGGALNAAWNFMKPILKKLKDALDAALGPLDEIIGGAAKLGGKAIGGAIGGIKGLFSHTGGMVPGHAGQNVPMVLQAGERVVPRGQNGGGGGTVVINLHGVGMGRDFGRAVADVLRENKLLGVT